MSRIKLKPIKDRVIVVTGASSGIGLVTARMAAKHGARLVLVARLEDALRKLTSEITAAGGKAIHVVAIDTPHAKHARNYVPVEPKNPPPVYAPEVVAEAILYSAAHPERDVFAGGGGEMISAQGYYLPRLTDKHMEKVIVRQQKTDRPSDNSRHRGLYEASGELKKRGGYPGKVFERSAYTKVSPRPLLATALVVGAGLGVAALLSSTSFNGDQKT